MTRNLTVYYHNRNNRNYYHGYNPRYTTVPEIRLVGNWLEAAGYNVGDKINVVITDGIITIQKEGGR